MSVTDSIKSSPQKIKLTWLQPQIRGAIESYLNQLIAGYGNNVWSVTLYGSQARGEAEPDSDIDLLIVLSEDSPALRQALIDLAWQVQFEYDVIISDIICSLNQFQQMQANRFPYYQSIETEGVLLWKNTSEPTPAFA
jgi:predicted nucleotidyltransferase